MGAESFSLGKANPLLDALIQEELEDKNWNIDTTTRCVICSLVRDERLIAIRKNIAVEALQALRKEEWPANAFPRKGTISIPLGPRGRENRRSDQTQKCATQLAIG